MFPPVTHRLPEILGGHEVRSLGTDRIGIAWVELADGSLRLAIGAKDLVPIEPIDRGPDAAERAT